ncbi:uncharacterized protein BKA78DRAFT_6488 [Phyllosticta capitalensis]|uniref:uncharacterized protein n=1 Tax=Phyllosticta capitalensis TaxID=121624 RepID=UPI00312FA146
MQSGRVFFSFLFSLLKHGGTGVRTYFTSLFNLEFSLALWYSETFILPFDCDRVERGGASIGAVVMLWYGLAHSFHLNFFQTILVLVWRAVEVLSVSDFAVSRRAWRAIGG